MTQDVSEPVRSDARAGIAGESHVSGDARLSGRTALLASHELVPMKAKNTSTDVIVQKPIPRRAPHQLLQKERPFP
jgi:hypothetical protein